MTVAGYLSPVTPQSLDIMSSRNTENNYTVTVNPFINKHLVCDRVLSSCLLTNKILLTNLRWLGGYVQGTWPDREEGSRSSGDKVGDESAEQIFVRVSIQERRVLVARLCLYLRQLGNAVVLRLSSLSALHKDTFSLADFLSPRRLSICVFVCK